MNGRIDKAAAEKAVSQKKRMLVFGLCSLAALVICMSSVLLVAFSLITEGVYEFPEERAPSAVPLPGSGADTVACLENLVSGADDSSVVRVDTKTEVGIENLYCDGSKSELAALGYMKDTIVASIDKMYPEDYNGRFGDGFAAFPVISLGGGDYSSAVCTEGLTADDGTITDDGFYFFTVIVPGAADNEAAPGVYKTFRLGGDDEVIVRIKNETSSVVKINEVNFAPDDFTIEAKSDRLTGRICRLALTRRYGVTLSVEFIGSLSPLGARTVGFDYTVTESFDYTWAGISFTEESVTLRKGKSLELPVSAVINDNDNYEIRFESSDEAVATVDSLGYVTGVGTSRTPAVIAVYLSYLGREYKDECKVFVCVPVEKIKISKDEAVVSVGEKIKLSAKISPKNATNRDVLWISGDKSVAAVSGSGEVTATGRGTTTIIAVSADGHYRDSCVVTVTE